MANKIIGYVFLFLGVIMILWGVWFSYGIFTGEKPSPELFKVDISKEVSKKEASLPQAEGLNEQMQNQISSLLQSQLGNLISGDSINKVLNLTAWSIFMAILVLACGKISLIGIQLIKAEPKKES
jgi:type VI protein secretion system component VasK